MDQQLGIYTELSTVQPIRKGIQRYQQGIRDRAAPRIEGGDIIRVEAHPIPEHPRPWRVKDRAILVGDAAGYVPWSRLGRERLTFCFLCDS